MKAISNIRAVMAILIFFFSLSFVSCTEETLDYNNPDVDLFVKQLKAGKYSVESPEGLNTIPRFTVDDIGVWGRMLRWGAKWYMWMQRIMKAFTSYRMMKFWMLPPVIAAGGKTANTPVRCGP